MAFDFDEKINRVNTHSSKWDMMEPLYGVAPEDGISMWVADMDFRPPEAVSAALKSYVSHGVFGYFGDDSEMKAALVDWSKRRHGWEIEADWVTNTHGLVQAVAFSLQAFSNPGEGVILFTPVYHAFARMILSNNRKVVESPLIEVDGEYRMNLDALEAGLKGDERILVLCSPHNPGGRVWRDDELKALAKFCERNHLLLISDEIHQDLVYGENSHQVMGKLYPEISDRLVHLVAATKTFNLAGGLTGSVVIENKKLREKFQKTVAASGFSPNAFGMCAMTAAYQHGDAWLDALLPYLKTNIDIFNDAMRQIPGVKPMDLQATYLTWVDFRDLGLSDADLHKRVQQDARIAANHGETFGKDGAGFLRFNIATPRANVEEAAARLLDAFRDIQ